MPRGFRADRKSWAVLRRRVFVDPPKERNRIWQTDFSEFETTSGGIWRICAVIDYAAKYCLAVSVTPTSRGTDALACLQAAVAEAQRLLGLDDLRADRGWMDLYGPTTPCSVGRRHRLRSSPTTALFRGTTYATAFEGEDRLLRHVRTRVRSPQTNGVVERFFGTLKYEHLYRGEIGDGDVLSVEVNRFRQVYNTIRPHQALGDRTPGQAYLASSGIQSP